METQKPRHSSKSGPWPWRKRKHRKGERPHKQHDKPIQFAPGTQNYPKTPHPTDTHRETPRLPPKPPKHPPEPTHEGTLTAKETPIANEEILPLLEAFNKHETRWKSSQLSHILDSARRALDPTTKVPKRRFLSICLARDEESGVAGILVGRLNNANEARKLQGEKATRTKQAWRTMAPTPVLEEFLRGISRIVRDQNGREMQEWLVVEPPFVPQYNTMIAELKASYPGGNEEMLESKVQKLLPEAKNGMGGSGTWSPFIKFMTQYLIFMREVDPSDLLETYNQLSELVTKANSAFQHPSLGTMLLGTIILYSKLLARLAIGLDKQPELASGLAEQSGEDGGETLSLPERAANIVRSAFVMCLNHKSDGASEKKAGIYTLANLCLKILFQCRKTKNGFQIFNNIYATSPPLSLYPAAQRVTFLYYLGRFHFSTSHFYRAQLALQSAYDQCPVHNQFRHQRRLILIYLLASNIILGRFPTDSLYRLPEAHGLKERFQPLCYAIRMGDLTTFRRLTDFRNEHAPWFIYFRIFLQLRNRCEVLVWRSLIRRTFILNGEQGGGDSRAAPNMHLMDIVHVSQFLEKRALNPIQNANPGLGRGHMNWMFMSTDLPKTALYTDAEFEGTEDDALEQEEQGEDEEDPFCLPDMFEIESIVASLIDQGLLNGFISHRLKKFAILGARTKGALQAGFPNVWEITKGKYDEEVPGWKKEYTASGAGMVYNLGAVKEIGA